MYVIDFVLQLLEVWFSRLDGFYVVSLCCSSYCHASQCFVSVAFVIVGAIFCHGLGLYVLALCKCCCLRRVCRFHFKMLVLLISIFVFGVVGVVVVVVSWLLSLSIVYSYLLVTGTVFLKQVQVCNAG